MRFEIVIFLIAFVIIANIYTEGNLLKKAFEWKKYYKMAGVAIVALFICWLMNKNPENAKHIIMKSNEYVKYLPIDRNTANFINPILDFTKNTTFKNDNFNNHPIIPMNEQPPINNAPNNSSQRILNSGKTSTKRSVSETKKKFVAASQQWKCGKCKRQLPAWFEVDHKIRLEYGGSNHVENLVALCRDCHGEKTAIENL
jgi:5-methylcytosine-specific restriction endonuclease McrA